MTRVALIVSIALLARCAHYPINDKLAQANIETGYRYANMNLPREDDTFIVLTFSGGGSRAAAFAYGVLRELEAVQYADGSRLLASIEDETFRNELNAVGTNFALGAGQLDLLMRAARELLAESDAYQQFLRDSGGKLAD